MSTRPSLRLQRWCVAAGLVLSLGTSRAEGPKPDRVRLGAARFVQGSNDHEEDERPQRLRNLPSFWIDRTEVTQGQYALCVKARRCKPLEANERAPSPDAALPVTQVSWHEARAYCRFMKGRLPTEAEWERAARGANGRVFPWGDELSCARGNWGSFEREGPCGAENPGHPQPVGSHAAGATPEGILDLAGNVWEWVADAYDRDPVRRIVKGGSCCSYFVEPRASNRNAWAPTHRDGDLGFRCAY
ncbi:MAG: formylglycine-generating enzyme family protein [Myxococcales bacterium]|nr:formylglycine-generating enzyme family protein [Myxococcales bacterium]